MQKLKNPYIGMNRKHSIPDAKTIVSRPWIFSASNEFKTSRLNNISHIKLFILAVTYNMDCVRTKRLRSPCFRLLLKELLLPPPPPEAVTVFVAEIALQPVVPAKSCRADCFV